MRSAENCPPDSFLIRLTVGPLGQILHVDVELAGLVSLEAAVLGARRPGLKITQVAARVSDLLCICDRVHAS